jgi:myo-inositol-1(or 4)-monophosphatase
VKRLQKELDLAVSAARCALALLADALPHQCELDVSEVAARELKASIDKILETKILGVLSESAYPVLSEESEAMGTVGCDGLRWVVDPLDGTVNYARGLGPCSTSIALCEGIKPLFGIIGEYPSGRLAWGGRQLRGAFLDGVPLAVSDICLGPHSVLCTGIPSRFDYSDESVCLMLGHMRRFGKVRMLGAASLSLLRVAMGAAEAYFEKDIMIWDVAAGVAIVEGAGGNVRVRPGKYDHSYDVYASNARLTGWENTHCEY